MSFFNNLFNRKELPKDKEGTKEGENILEKGEKEGLDDFSSDEDDSTDEEDILEEEEDSDFVYEEVEREILPAKIICPDCGGITLEGLDFCDKCGGEL